ncbi:MAG: YidC/Oxa1 family insertase periplasmic-domain containing protein [Chthoniobacteraceae bacterium]
MDKKGIFGIVLCVIGLVGWQVYQGKQLAAYQVAKAAYDAEMAKLEPATKPATAPGSPQAPAVVAPAAPVVEEKPEKLRTSSAEYVFTNLGGGISRVTLDDHVIETARKTKVVINEFGTTPIGAVSEAAGDRTNIPFTTQADAAAGTVTFERVDEKQLALSKRFTLPKFDRLTGNERLREEFLITLDLTFTNRGAQPLAVPAYWVHLGSAGPLHEKDAPLYIGFNYLRGEGFGTKNHFTDLSWFAEGGFLMFSRGARAVYPEQPELLSDVRWASVANQYFCTLITPQVNTKATTDVQAAARGTGVWARRTTIPAAQWNNASRKPAGVAELHGIDGAVQMGGFALEPGATATRSFRILAGPSEYRRLRHLDNSEAEILDFGIFGWISKGLLTSLNWFKSLLGSYWAAIMVLTIIIRSAMWPLQNRATETAKKMQALSPRLKEIQERYKDDPMRLQQETGKMWKQYGINPLGGCLPMFVQIPIFFGFYNMLNKAVELRNNGFLWVTDLSQPDTVLTIAGFPLNILPLIMAGTMVVQMKLTPKAGDPMMQRMMMFMPLIFIALCYNYAAALALYWSVQNLFSIVQLYVTRDKQAAQPALVEVIPPPTKPKRKS